MPRPQSLEADNSTAGVPRRSLLRGMLGMGAAFAAAGTAIMVPLAIIGFVSFLRNGTDKDDLDFLILAPFVWIAISFGLGMAYAGLLARVARGRSFDEVSVPRVATAGAVVGLVPAAVVAAGSVLGGGTLTAGELLTPLILFPPISAAVASATLLVARRAKPPALKGGFEATALGRGRTDASD